MTNKKINGMKVAQCGREKTRGTGKARTLEAKTKLKKKKTGVDIVDVTATSHGREVG